ncbi:MAG: hypothetical protein ACD_80C00072G0003 [uncultured bacterium (gcode 4)]|uniref:Baseplate protein J-like domain-containing protein n=1 Tax=uncultured bacterium (gcode 4) TaxID=1234023 RepID=K1X5C2_9BACT|nr:MAG: hypothetical protein ACD_80C00072G0003 [uncultured bacterium (gcode 4)]
MKLFFLKEHSLYKIFKTIEKVPNGRTIYIYIDTEHSFFDNERRGKEIKELLQKKDLNAMFVTKTEKSKYFFSSLGLNVLHQEKHKIIKYLRLIYDFFFNIKKFHLQVYTKKNYIFYVVFGFEVIFVLVILFLLYSLILPSTNINITPTSQIESVIYNFRYYPSSDTEFQQYSRYLSVSYYTGYIDYKYDMTVSTANIKYIQHPSQGTIELINKTPKDYSFVKNTRFVTDDGRQFISLKDFSVLQGTENNPGKKVVLLQAMEQDIQWVLMGSRGNITKWTKVFIKNMTNSYYSQNIYGQVIENFSGGNLQSQWVVSVKDIGILSGKLVDAIYKQKSNIVTNNFKSPENIVLNFDSLITTEIKDIQIHNVPGEKTPLIKWSIIVRFNFNYIKKADLLSVVDKYVKQRLYDKMKLFEVDTSSIVFFKDLKQESWHVFVIPTKVDIKQSYDFAKDINGIVSDIKERTIGLTEDKAREILFSYPEISSFTIKIKPRWYTTVSKLKSRINVYVDGKTIK